MIDKERKELREEIAAAMNKFMAKTNLAPVIEANLFRDALKKWDKENKVNGYSADINITYKE